ncbi:MAG: hypothetical protein M3R15_24265, partial [Acidobacteriota bacterium]|nr:hypothetical protein [Acidobacteriota bacterium]
MRSTLLRAILTFITLGTLVVSPPSFAQDQTPPHQQTRPRRISDGNAVSEQATPQISISTSTSATNSETRHRSEPLMRIGLATDARAASISTTSQLVTSSEEGAPSQTLGVTRVRIEPRLLSPYPSTRAPEDSTESIARASGTRAARVNSEPARTAPAPRASKESNVRLAARPAPALLMRAAMVYGGGTVP